MNALWHFASSRFRTFSVCSTFCFAFIALLFSTQDGQAAALSCLVPTQAVSGTLSVNNGTVTEPLTISNLAVGATVTISATATTGGGRTVSFTLTAGSGSGPTPTFFALNANAATNSSIFTNSNASGTADIDITLSSSQNGNRTIDWSATCAPAVAVPIVTISNTIDGAEPSTNGILTVTQDIISPTDTVIAYSVAGSATAGVDYTVLPGSATILAGDTTATIIVPILDDSDIEGDETVNITLTSVTSGSATLGATVSAINTIGDDDVATNASLEIIKIAYEGGLPPELGGTGTLIAPNRPVGTVITYVFTVTNNGDVPIFDVQVSDTHNGSGGVITPTHLSLIDNGTIGDSPDSNPSNLIWGTLGPSDIISFTGTYTITQTDVDTLQ